MTTEELKERYDRFMELVKRLRKYTQAWVLYKASADKNNMIRYQREIDKWLAEEPKLLDSKQPELFK